MLMVIISNTELNRGQHVPMPAFLRIRGLEYRSPLNIATPVMKF